MAAPPNSLSVEKNNDHMLQQSVLNGLQEYIRNEVEKIDDMLAYDEARAKLRKHMHIVDKLVKEFYNSNYECGPEFKLDKEAIEPNRPHVTLWEAAREIQSHFPQKSVFEIGEDIDRMEKRLRKNKRAHDALFPKV